MNKKTKKNFWETVSFYDWKNIHYPWRPSKKELNFYQKKIKDFKNKNVLLLGSTPEIRKIASNLKITIDVIDFSKKMYVDMAKVINISTVNENFYNMEWTEFVSNTNKKYDLIIGDLVERLIPKKEFENLIIKFNKILNHEGKLLFRMHFLQKTTKKIDPNTLFGFFHLFLNIKKDSDLLFFLLTPYFIEKDNGINIKKILKYAEKIIKTSNGRKKLLFKEFWKKCKTYKLQIYAHPYTSINSIFEKRFLLKENINHTITNKKIDVNYTSLRFYEKLS